MRQPARLTRNNHVCVFGGSFIREQIDPRVKEIWEKATGQPAPFGRLRRAFQTEHCSKINPYAGECPYRVEECAMAFLSGVQNSTLPWIEDPAAYFVKLVASTGIDRADNKPLARDRHREKDSDQASSAPGSSTRRLGRATRPSPSPGSSSDEVAGDPDEDHLRRARHRPDRLGDLLGSLNLGAREGRAADGEEG